MAEIVPGTEMKQEDAPTEGNEACPDLYFVALRDIEVDMERCDDYCIEYWNTDDGPLIWMLSPGDNSTPTGSDVRSRPTSLATT